LLSNLGARTVEVLRVGCAFVEIVALRVRARFGAFVFDDASRELRSGGQPVPISPKAFDLLCVLFQARPRALSKAELRDRLWPDTIVGETSLPRVVGEIRRALGDRPEEASFVRTVQRFGYAFVGDAVVEGEGNGAERSTAAPTTGCTLLWGERIVSLLAGPNVVGRDPDCAVAIPSSLVSRQHARLVIEGERAVLHDLGSKNGTQVGGRRVDGSIELTDGDEIRIGPALLVFCAPAAGSTRTRR
jgi:DNA-binding winged helix-turn-helix (wHTH) protein